jgi:hypothetical protein
VLGSSGNGGSGGARVSDTVSRWWEGNTVCVLRLAFAKSHIVSV